jgi:hypothetical protein
MSKVQEDINLSLATRIKAIEDSDRTLNQEAARAIIDLQRRVEALERDLARHTRFHI